jgi:hypothetical protein
MSVCQAFLKNFPEVPDSLTTASLVAATRF